MANISRNPQVRRSKPTFQLTHVIDIDVIRKQGQWVKGKWKEEESGRFTIEGNLQPVKFSEILQMPEADRTKEWIKIYTTYHLVTAEESDVTGNLADVVLWEGHQYKVMKEKHYVMGVLDHRMVYCAKEPVSALEED